MMFCLAGLSLGAQQPPPTQIETQTATSDVFRGKASDLQNHPFQMGALRVSFDCRRPLLGGGGTFDIRIDNPTGEFLDFNPWSVIFVDSTGCQVQLFEPEGSTWTTSFSPFRVAPHAFALRTVSLRSRPDLRQPFKVYLGEKLIAVITG
jgi:hypothetical protein